MPMRGPPTKIGGGRLQTNGLFAVINKWVKNTEPATPGFHYRVAAFYREKWKDK
jgi:hypothetical protein